jgi:hypothetical protein
MHKRRHYTKTANIYGDMLCVLDKDAQQLELLLKRVKEAIALFKEENVLFDAKRFVAIMGERAFPDDSRKHSELLAKLLDENG